MGFLDKLRGRSKTATITTETAKAICPHTSLVPRWDSVADMGREDKATNFTCQGCQQTFTPEQARALRRTEAERVQSDLEVKS